MARVECGRAFFRSQIVRILWKRRAGEVEIYSIRGSINGFSPGIGGKPGNPMELGQAHGGLQRVACRICASGENINCALLSVREVLVLVIKPRQLVAFCPYLTEYEGDGFPTFLLHIHPLAL